MVYAGFTSGYTSFKLVSGGTGTPTSTIDFSSSNLTYGH